MRKQNVRISLKLTGEQIKFLKCLSRECRHNGGIKLSRSCILRCLIKTVTGLDLHFAKSKCEKDLFRFLLEVINEMR